ncbi:MBL fold metallo-hydrolase [Methylobacterium sp. Leaf118]|uniref:MBL fold metallo-hydrolase n=1 Tax=Methylobacterium sp. Leaf118 TaxID=2876562 RepID=UPI001E3E3B05|nr:MBL fold metallo-hydrolase [Methylobacterium sp. Leaf118]
MTPTLGAADPALEQAQRQVAACLSGAAPRPVVRGFFDEATHTATFVVHDPHSREAAVIDSVLDFDPASGTLSSTAVDPVIDYIRAENLTVAWILETHVHADHLSAAPSLQAQLGGRLAIGRGIVAVQETFGTLFNAGTDFARTGAEFDRLFEDGERFRLGGIEAVVLHVPGHTPADLAYVIGDAAFVGDTLFMPDYGTARADFPGGDARLLFRSIRRLLSLPDATRLFLCHDYKAPGRDRFVTETSVAAQRTGNVHVRDGTDEDQFVAMRTARDRTLPAPRLIMPSIQVNMRGGRLPEPEANGTRYLKIPLTTGRG